MKRVSVRTLILLTELLLVVVIHQFLVHTPTARAAAVWLADVPDEVVDPNSVQDPNAPGEPEPECIAPAGARVWLDDEPVDPNAPDEPESPPPEATIGVPALRCL